MKKRLLIALVLLAATSTVFISSCKKSDDESTDPTPKPKPIPAENVLCEGNGSASFLPLNLINSWTYSYTVGGASQSVHPELFVSGMATHDSRDYFKIEDQTNSMTTVVLYYREDASNHNIYYYDGASNAEFLYVPGTPTVNQSWPYAYTQTRKVTSVSAAVTTSGCTYYGLIEISQFNLSNVLQRKEYFKKGVGMIQRLDPNGVVGGYDKFIMTDIRLN